MWTFPENAKWNQGDRNMQRIRKLIRNNKAATAIEYGLIAALIAVAGITAMSAVGSGVKGAFTDVATNLGQTVP